MLKNLYLAHKASLMLRNKKIIILILILGGIGLLGILGFQKITAKPEGPVEEVDLAFDAEGPYALLSPRRDGNALVLNLKRTSSYDSISYELAYSSSPDETVVKGTKITDDGEGGRVTGS